MLLARGEGGTVYDHGVRVINDPHGVLFGLDLFYLSRVPQAFLITMGKNTLGGGDHPSWDVKVLRKQLRYLTGPEGFLGTGGNILTFLKKMSDRDARLNELLTKPVGMYLGTIRRQLQRNGRQTSWVVESEDPVITRDFIEKVTAYLPAKSELLLPERRHAKEVEELLDTPRLTEQGKDLLEIHDHAVGAAMGLTPDEVDVIVGVYTTKGWDDCMTYVLKGRKGARAQ